MTRLAKTMLAAGIMVLLAACGTKTNTMDKNMNTLTLTESQADCMAVIACNAAKGDQSSLADAITDGLAAGISENQIKDALSQLYAYAGFPRSLNALGILQRVVKTMQEEKADFNVGPEASPLPKDYNALEQGTAIQTRLSGQPFDYTYCPATDFYLKAHLFGDIFASDVLTHAERELVTVGALSGIEGVMPQLQAHVRGALNMGVSEEQLAAIPEALKGGGLIAEAQRCEAAIAAVQGRQQVASPSSFPLGQPNDAYAKYFIGQSYLAVLDTVSGMCNVTFEPCCRNNWHIHHHAVQVLTCVNGRGWYQEWGKEPVELKPGTVVSVPAGTKHWHGAAKDSWMQHLAYFTAQEPGFRNEWLEPVDDEQYNKLK